MSEYRWDPWKRCQTPDVMTLQLPHGFKGHVYTAERRGKWYYGYHCDVHKEAWIPVRSTGQGYDTQRQAKMAALVDFHEAVLIIRQDVSQAAERRERSWRGSTRTRRRGSLWS